MDHGLFGLEETGPIEPDEEQIIALVDEQGLELLGVLVDLSAAREGLRTGIDPRSGSAPRTESQRIRLTERLHDSVRRLTQTREDLLGVYADAFGEENATLLDEHVQLWLTGRLKP